MKDSFSKWLEYYVVVDREGVHHRVGRDAAGLKFKTDCGKYVTHKGLTPVFGEEKVDCIACLATLAG